MRRSVRAACAALLLTASAADAQSVSDGSDAAIGEMATAGIFTLIGRLQKQPAAAVYAGLRSGRAGGYCGTVDTVNRMGNRVGPRPFVVDAAAGFGGIRPDAPELRHPASMAEYQAMQRVLALYAENCAAD